MSEFSNPYRPGEPVVDLEMLFGRQSTADWIDLQIAGKYRVLILSALPMVGKTSFLRHTGSLQGGPFQNLLVSLADLPLLNGEDEQSLNTVLRAVIEQLEPQLTLLNLVDAPVSSDTVTAPASSTLRKLFAQANRMLQPHRPLVLYIDDLHLLVGRDKALIASFLTSLMPLLDECPALHLVLTGNQSRLKHIKHSLLDGAPVYNLGTLSPDASIDMVTRPVKGVLRFDYGVTKRISEINSHHPYYLSLYCHTLLNRQMHDGWVNQQDFDTTLGEILDSSIEPFTRIWDEASWAERSVLSGMSAIQGAHGPITGQEIIRFMQRLEPAVDADVVEHALAALAERGVLIPMGAVSYRFHVELLRFWLREHTVPTEIIAQVNWSKSAATIKPAADSRRLVQPAPRRTVPANQRRQSLKIRWIVPVVIIILLACVGLVSGGLIAARSLGLPIAYLSPPAATPTATTTQNNQADAPPVEAASGAQAEATPTPLPEPTASPTPTPALVVARTLPSITYMGRDVDQNWRIYVMDADGANPLALTPAGETDDASPVWSTDGQKVAFVSRRDGNREIYVMDSDGQNVVNVTRHPADDWTPAWSPDGAQLAFSSFREGSWEIFVMNTACLEDPPTCPDNLTRITGDGNGNLSPTWSPDGARFAFNSKANGNWDIYTMAADGSDIRQVTVAPENDLAPIWSPDGAQLAFESNREGNVEVFVIGAAGGEARNISNMSLADDHGPTWSPDGQQLVFYSNREGNWDIFAVAIDGSVTTNLTNTPSRDEQTPAWRP